MDKRAVFVVGLVLGLALVIAFEAKRRKPEWTHGYDLVPIVVVEDDLPAGTVLTFEHVGQRSVPSMLQFSSYVKPDAASKAVGKRLTTALEKGEPVRWQDLEPEPELKPGS